MARSLRAGWRTALPVVIAPDTPLVFRAWSPGDRLEPGVWDIPVPLASAPEVLPDLLLVPASASTARDSARLWRGFYYDRTLAKLRAVSKPVTAIGLPIMPRS